MKTLTNKVKTRLGKQTKEKKPIKDLIEEDREDYNKKIHDTHKYLLRTGNLPSVKNQSSPKKASKIMVGGLAATLIANTISCSNLFPKSYERTLIEHPSYEIYDESDMSPEGDFFHYSNGILTIEGISYPATQAEPDKYVLDKALLEKVLGFISSKIKIKDGTDFFIPNHMTDLETNFYKPKTNSKGEVVNDHIYLKPRDTNPLFLREKNTEIGYNSDLIAGLIGVFLSILHEYNHQEYWRNEEKFSQSYQESKKRLEQIITKDLRIIVSEQEPRTQGKEVDANMFALTFFLKFQKDFERHIKEDYEFENGTQGLSYFNMPTVLELMTYHLFEWENLSKGNFQQSREIVKEKLNTIREKLPELEKILFN